MKLGFRAKHLALLGTEVGGAVAVELDSGAQIYELELVQPARMHFDFQPEQDVEGGVALDVDGRAGALHHRPRPCSGVRRAAESGYEGQQEQAGGTEKAHASNLRNSGPPVKFPTAFVSTRA